LSLRLICPQSEWPVPKVDAWRGFYCCAVLVGSKFMLLARRRFCSCVGLDAQGSGVWFARCFFALPLRQAHHFGGSCASCGASTPRWFRSLSELPVSRSMRGAAFVVALEFSDWRSLCGAASFFVFLRVACVQKSMRGGRVRCFVHLFGSRFRSGSWMYTQKQLWEAHRLWTKRGPATNPPHAPAFEPRANYATPLPT
jgi:hypothetical protein